MDKQLVWYETVVDALALSPPQNPLAMKVQGSSAECSEMFKTRLCRTHHDQRSGRSLEQSISLALHINNAVCVLGTESNKDAPEEVTYIQYCLLGLAFFYATRRSAWVEICFLVDLVLSVYSDSDWKK